MLLAFAFMENAKFFVIVDSPSIKDLLAKVHDFFFVFSRNTDGVRVIVHFRDFRAGFAGENDFFVFGSKQWKDWRTALEMLMVEDRATDDREVAVAAHEIDWELLNE